MALWVPFPLRFAKLLAMKPFSKMGHTTSHSAWCNDAVAKGRCGNQPLFGIVDEDFHIATRAITALMQLALKSEQFSLQICEECRGPRLPALTKNGALGRPSQCLKVCDLRK